MGRVYRDVREVARRLWFAGVLFVFLAGVLSVSCWVFERFWGLVMLKDRNSRLELRVAELLAGSRDGAGV